MSNLLTLEQSAFGSFKPPKKLSLSDWADEYAYLSAESSEGWPVENIAISKGNDGCDYQS